MDVTDQGRGGVDGCGDAKMRPKKLWLLPGVAGDRETNDGSGIDGVEGCKRNGGGGGGSFASSAGGVSVLTAAPGTYSSAQLTRKRPHGETSNPPSL